MPGAFKEFENLPDPFVVLFLADPKQYVIENLELMRNFVHEKKMFGIYITVNRPYGSLVQLLKKEKIDTSKIFFIDLITSTLSNAPERKENCIFMGSASNLTDLSLAISEAVEASPETKKFIFLDSLSTMLIYNEAGTLSKFSHFLTGRLRELKVSGVLISMDTETDRKLTTTLSQFCDRVVRRGV